MASPLSRSRTVFVPARSLGLAAVHAAVALGVLLADGAFAQPPLPQYDGLKHLGPNSCAGPVCHSSSEEPGTILGYEWSLWNEDDPHARNAYQALKKPRSKEISRKLGRKAEPWNDALCLDCHADNAAAEMRGSKFKLRQGVGCEACHGGAQKYLNAHDSGRPHAKNLADGMYPTDDPVARAELCLSCHYGMKDKFVTHRIMGAGHPRMSFDLAGFVRSTVHYEVDDDYAKRGKKAPAQLVLWAVGQAVAARSVLDALLDPQRSRDGIWPELVLFDCHACHHPMSDRRWRPRGSTALPPGLPRLSDGSFLMVHHALAALDAQAAEKWRTDLRRLHQATAGGSGAVQSVAAAMRTDVVAAIPRLAAMKADAARIRTVLRSLLQEGKSGEYVDYVAAEQATNAIQALAENLYQLGALSQGSLEQLRKELAVLLAAVEKDEDYDRAKAQQAFGRLEAILS